MAWKKPSAELGRILAEALTGLEAKSKPMFGCPAYFSKGNWFAGVHEDRLLVRLNEKDRAELWEGHPGARLFEPVPGRVMEEFVVLPPGVVQNAEELTRWFKRSHAYSANLPPKKKAKKKTGAKSAPQEPAQTGKKRS